MTATLDRPVKAAASAQPLRLSLKRTLIQQFDAETLYHLWWLKTHESLGMVARRQLSDSSIEELAELFVSGRTPTLGWWRRHAS